MIIGLSGHIKSGKSTAATIIKRFVADFEEKYFAYKLKYIAAYLTGDDIINFETQEGKETYLPKWGMTRRKILQNLGTESLRNNFDNDVWIKALFADYKEDPTCGCPLPNWIISDTRFKNEAIAIKELGGKILRINRPFSDIYPDMWNEYLWVHNHAIDWEPQEYDFINWLNDNNGKSDHRELYIKLTHPSEIGLDEYTDFDYTITNTGNLANLENEIKNFLLTQTHFRTKNLIAVTS